MRRPRLETHVLGQTAVRRLALDCASGVVSSPSPNAHPPRRSIYVTAQAALVRLLLLFEAIQMVGHKALRHADVDSSFGLLYELLPTGMAGIGRSGRVFGIEVRSLVFDHRRIAGKI